MRILDDDISDEEVKKTKEIADKYGVTAGKLARLCVVLMAHRYEYTDETIALLRAQVEIMEYIRDGKQKVH